MFHFYNNTSLNLLNISSLFSGGIITSSTFLGFSSVFTISLLLYLVTVSAILFPINSPAIWATFLKAVLAVSHPVFDDWFLYFLAND